MSSAKYTTEPYASVSGSAISGGTASEYGVEQISNMSSLREATVSDFPRSLIEFQQRFSDEGACAKYLFATRWPQGFVCPAAARARHGNCKPNRGHGNAPAAVVRPR